MKYSIRNYINALIGALNDTSDESKVLVLENFIQLVSHSGDLDRRDKIIEGVHRRVVNLNGGKWITVELAKETTEPRLRIIRELFSDKDHINVKLNPELANPRITVNGRKRVNNSVSTTLKKLFK